MDIFNVLSLIGGLALFLYGMNVMGDGLAKTAGGKLEKILEKLTSTPIKGVILGAAVTGVIQSSSATTVMVVGFVNSGIMKLTQAVGIIMGANIGTTVTSWILSLSGIQSDNFWIKMLKPSSFSPILAVIGIVFLLFTKSEKKHDIGTILLGFSVLMFGMETMSAAVKPLANVPEFTNILTMFSNPILGMLAGAVLTGAEEGQVSRMEQIAGKIGLAFQIQDDILDVTSTTELLGKPVHSDEKNEKTTYVTWKGIEKAHEDVERLTQEAVDLLRKFPAKDDFLEELLKSLVYREK